MDEIENTPGVPAEQPYPDFTPEPPRRSPLKWIVLLVVLLGGVGAFVFLGGTAFVTDWYASQPTMSQKSEKIEAWQAASSLNGLVLPGEVRFIGAYKAPFKNKNLAVFLAAPEKDPLVLPKDFAASLDLGAHKNAVYYLVVVDGPGVNVDGSLKAVAAIARQQGVASRKLDKMWIAGKETPLLEEDIVKDGKTFQLDVINVSEKVGLLAVTPSDALASAPNKEMMAALLQVKPSEISFLPPEPAGVTLARSVLSTDVAERKKAVPMLVTLGGPQLEAVAFLADAMPTAANDVKIDIVAALGLLAPTTPVAVQPLIVALNDKTVRLEAMAALGSLGKAASEAVPTLQKIAANKKESKVVRASANTALAKITGRPQVPAGKKKKRR